MPAGTITLKNNSAGVTGSGTAFSTELKANDFIVVTVGQTVYTLGVKSVESNTALTLVRNFDGPSSGGLAWTPIPYGAMVTITAQTHAYTTEAIRGLLLDKNNWQQVFSGTGNITVTLPDGSTFTGPAWNSFISELNLKADKTEVDKKADKTALDNKAANGDNSDITSIKGLKTPLSLSQGGTGGKTQQDACNNLGVKITRIGDAILTSIGGNIVKQEGIIGAQQPVGAYNSQNIGGVTWYTHFYSFSLPAAFPNAVVSCVATLVSPRGDQQAAGTPAFIACTRDKNGGGASRDAITVSITTPVTGWYPYFNFSAEGY
ncbi:hypothetical protein ABTW52_06025 [Serratia sp. SM29]|uniref:hypothetical protein n=1 Tax=Serratia sp. SM29 TaxID=3162877 RepID=UPI0033157057